MSIHAFPRSAAYLRAMNVQIDDPGLTDYWCAVILADAFTDEEVGEAGIDFGTGPVAQRDGTAILSALDKLLATRQSKPKRRVSGLPQADFDALKAFLGSRGIKAGKLHSEADFWTIATTLWPKIDKRDDKGLGNLLAQLRGMSNRQRKTANDRLHLVSSQFRAAPTIQTGAAA